MVPSNRVDQTPYKEEWNGKETGGEYDVPRPATPPHLAEHAGRHEPTHSGGECIEQYRSGVETAVPAASEERVN